MKMNLNLVDYNFDIKTFNTNIKLIKNNKISQSLKLILMVN